MVYNVSSLLKFCFSDTGHLKYMLYMIQNSQHLVNYGPGVSGLQLWFFIFHLLVYDCKRDFCMGQQQLSLFVMFTIFTPLQNKEVQNYGISFQISRGDMLTTLVVNF